MQKDSPPEQRPNVFVSYAHEDQLFRELVESEIEKLGFAVWRDTKSLRGGEAWGAKIDEALSNATALVLLVTDASNESQYVSYEWAFAIGAGIPVIPLLRSAKELHPRLTHKHFLDFRDPHRPWKELAAALEAAREARPLKDRATPAQRRFSELMVELETGDPAKAMLGFALLDHPEINPLLISILKDFDGTHSEIYEHALTAAVARKTEGVASILIDRFQQNPTRLVAKTLGDIGHDVAIEPLAKVLDSNYHLEDLHQAVLSALGNFSGDNDAPRVVRDYFNRVRLVPTLERHTKSAIDALRRLSVDESAINIIPFLDHQNMVDVALDALGEFNSEEATEAIVKRIPGWTEATRTRAMRVLRGSRSKGFAQAIAEFLLQPNVHDKNHELAVEAAGTLAEMEDRGKPYLIQALESAEAIPRAAAAQALRVVRRPDLVAQLGRLLDDPRKVESLKKLEFTWRLMKSGQYTDSKRICDIAREALLSIGTPAAIEMLRQTPPLPLTNN